MVRSVPVVLLLGLCAVLLVNGARAQPETGGAAAPAPDDRHNAIYLELLGSGGGPSLNYERQVPVRDVSWLRFQSRVGASYVPNIKGNPYDVWVPVLLGPTLGDPHHALELGIGPLLVIERRTGPDGPFRYDDTRAAALIGYRYESDGGFLLRVSYTPFTDDASWTSWGGLSLGYAF